MSIGEIKPPELLTAPEVAQTKADVLLTENRMFQVCSRCKFVRRRKFGGAKYLNPSPINRKLLEPQQSKQNSLAYNSRHQYKEDWQ